MSFVFVAGAAHLDILSSTEDKSNVIDKAGKLTISFGGTAHNIATNLAIQDIPTTLMSALNTGAIADMILDELSRNHVRLHVQRVSTTDEAGFVAQTHQGELTSAVTASLVDQVIFSGEFVTRGIGNAACIVADCNLSVQTLTQIIEIAKAKEIPVYIAAVSESKARKILEVPQGIARVTLNENEMNHLQSTLKTDSWQEVAKHTGHQFMITQGKKGVTLLSATEEVFVQNPQPLDQAISTLGCGDLFLASFIKTHLFDGCFEDEALQRAFDLTLKVLTQEQAHLGESHPLESGVKAAIESAHRDPLTGILNRQGIDHYMTLLDPAKDKLCAIMLDIDHFKKINDTHGHNAGDAVLQTIAENLQRSMRRGDAVGRWGGEEFICLLKNLSLEKTERMAERLRKSIEDINFVVLDGKNVTASFGVTLKTKNEDLTTVLGRADKALYQAKKNGRNQVVIAD